MPTHNVNLSEHLDGFVRSGILSGRFSDASEVIQAGLRLLEECEGEEIAKLEWLRAAAKEGFDDIDRGDYISIESDSDLDEFMKQVHDEASAKIAAGRKIEPETKI